MRQSEKKSPGYPTESKWTVSEGEYNGKPIYVRVNASAAQLSGHPDFSTRVGVALPLSSPTRQGLPGADEIGQLDAIEDAACLIFEAQQKSLHVLTITTGGMRELVFYARSPSSAQSAIEALSARVQTHSLQHYIAEDPQWSLYAQFS